MRNTLLIGFNTFQDAIRQKLVLLILLISAILAGFSNYMLRFDLGHEKLKFIFDFASGAITFFGAIIAIVATSQLIHSEIDNKTIVTTLSKPVNFLQWTFGKLIGVAFTLAVFVTVVCTVSCIMLYFTEFQLSSRAANSNYSAINLCGILCYGILQWAKLSTISAVTAAVCAVSGSLMFSVISSFLILAATMIRSANLWFGGNENIAGEIASAIFPNLEIFAKSENFAFSAIDVNLAISAGAYALIYFLLCTTIASWLLSKREF